MLSVKKPKNEPIRKAPALCAFLLWIACLSPSFAFATMEEDQTPLTDSEIQKAIDEGSMPGFLNSSDASSVAAYSNDQSDPVTVFAGEDRYDTSAKQALGGWDSCGTVLVVSGGGWPDALGASGLAGALDCPILLTDPGSLPSSVAQAIAELGATHAIVVGGQTAVSEQVVSDLKAAGAASVERLGGDTRYGTQMEIYRYGKERSLWDGSTAIVANGSGSNFADALSASPVAFAEKAPIFIANESGALPDEQKRALDDAAQEKIFNKYLIIGGNARVSDFTEGYLTGLSLLGDESASGCERVAGETRYETSAAVASWAISNRILSADNAGFASATSPYDALGGGALQGHRGSVLLLVSDGSYSAAVGSLSSGGVGSISFFGGDNAISANTRKSISRNLGLIKELYVYLDAGHGMSSSDKGVYDGGAEYDGGSEHPSYREADLTKELARLIGEDLESNYDVKVHVNDYGGWYKLRHAEAVSLGCDLLVSIHFNSGGGTGCESYIHSVNAAPGSSILQKDVHPQLVKGMALLDRGMKSAQFAVVSGQLPAVLLEIGFIDNPHDMAQYQSRKQIVAHDIAEGIMEYAL